MGRGFGGHGALIDSDTGEVVAILDWDVARLAPREHDLWAAFEEPDPLTYLDAYGRDVDLDRAHLEYALLGSSQMFRDGSSGPAPRTRAGGLVRIGSESGRRAPFPTSRSPSAA